MSDTKYPPTWRPAEGDRLIGRIVDKRMATTKYGERPVAEIETDEGERLSVWMGSTILREFYDRINEGDEVDIAYEGKRTAKAGNEYSSYQVEVTAGAPADG